MATVNNVSTGKPKIGGAINSAPIGTALPTDATTQLAEAYKNFGYVSEDGLTNSNSAESDSVKAWGGDEVLNIQTEKPDHFTYTLIEVTNPDVLKHVYGSENVTGTYAAGITITANSKPQESQIIVFDMILRDGGLKRIVCPNAQVISVGDIVYNDSDPIGYEIELACYPDATGNTHYEYIVKN